jgi:hypothetical protein
VAQLRGAKITEEEKESYWHLWRYIGYMLGIDDQVMPQKYDDGLSARYATNFVSHTTQRTTTTTNDAPRVGTGWARSTGKGSNRTTPASC